MTETTLTPGQAAKRVGCGRTSIMRALTSGELRAIRNNLGQWQIDLQVLDDWSSLRRSPDRQQPDTSLDTSPVTLPEPPVTSSGQVRGELEQMREERDNSRLEAASLRAENLQLRERVDLVQAEREREVAQLRERLDAEVTQLREDRDRWHALATAPRPGFLERVRLLLRPARMTAD